MYNGYNTVLYFDTKEFTHPCQKVGFVIYVHSNLFFFYTVEELCTESGATLPPFGPIEGQKWFDRISSQ
jgi:hypothetical protein